MILVSCGLGVCKSRNSHLRLEISIRHRFGGLTHIRLNRSSQDTQPPLHAPVRRIAPISNRGGKASVYYALSAILCHGCQTPWDEALVGRFPLTFDIGVFAEARFVRWCGYRSARRVAPSVAGLPWRNCNIVGLCPPTRISAGLRGNITDHLI